MRKRKRFRKVLNIFLCVLSLVVVLSVSVFADRVSLTGSGVAFTDGESTVEYLYDGDSNDFFMLYLYRDRVDVYHVVDGNFSLVYSANIDYVDFYYNRSTGEYIYFDSSNDVEEIVISVRSDSGIFYDIVPIRKGDVLVYIQNFTEMIFGVVTDFSKIISENALMLLFAIGLPVCSLGVGFLIRLKDCT